MYLKLDVNFPDDPRIIGLSLGAVGMYVSAMCISARLDSGGILSRLHLERLTDDTLDELKVIDELLNAELFENFEGGDILIAEWDDRVAPFVLGHL